MTWIKICGTTSLEDARISAAAGAHALGFIFAESARQVDASAAEGIVSSLGNAVETIGVFVNQNPQRVAGIVERVGLSGVQLHGDETPAQIEELRRRIGQRKIIKTLQAGALLRVGHAELDQYLAPEIRINAILLDSGSAKQPGGTGKAFAWEQLLAVAKTIAAVRPLIIAGGLNADNVARALDLFSPWGVDVVSGVESEPGKKDASKLRNFVAAVRMAKTVTSRK